MKISFVENVIGKWSWCYINHGQRR